MSKARKSRAVWLIILGALCGVLFAPASGHETRHTIAEEAGKGGRYVVALGHETREEAGHIAEAGRRIAYRLTHW